MRYDRLFSYIIGKDPAENIHQFRFSIDNGEPTMVDWENAIAGRLYSNILMQNDLNNIHWDLSDAKDKKTQLRDFLDYHYSKYGDMCFIGEIRELVRLFDSAFGDRYRITLKYKGFVNGIVLDWCNEQEVNGTVKSNSITNKQFKSFRDYLLCNEEQKEALMNKLSTLFENAKGKRIATILFALKELSLIYLETRGKAEMYRVDYII